MKRVWFITLAAIIFLALFYTSANYLHPKTTTYAISSSCSLSSSPDVISSSTQSTPLSFTYESLPLQGLNILPSEELTLKKQLLSPEYHTAYDQKIDLNKISPTSQPEDKECYYYTFSYQRKSSVPITYQLTKDNSSCTYPQPSDLSQLSLFGGISEDDINNSWSSSSSKLTICPERTTSCTDSLSCNINILDGETSYYGIKVQKDSCNNYIITPDNEGNPIPQDQLSSNSKSFLEECGATVKDTSDRTASGSRNFGTQTPSTFSCSDYNNDQTACVNSGYCDFYPAAESGGGCTGAFTTPSKCADKPLNCLTQNIDQGSLIYSYAGSIIIADYDVSSGVPQISVNGKSQILSRDSPTDPHCNLYKFLYKKPAGTSATPGQETQITLHGNLIGEKYPSTANSICSYLATDAPVEFSYNDKLSPIIPATMVGSTPVCADTYSWKIAYNPPTYSNTQEGPLQTLYVLRDVDACGNNLVTAPKEGDKDNALAGCKAQYVHTASLCGNGVINGDEECDGNDFGKYNSPQSSCARYSSKYNGGSLKCTTACTIDSSDCYQCGNGKIESPESCDNGMKCCNSTGSCMPQPECINDDDCQQLYGLVAGVSPEAKFTSCVRGGANGCSTSCQTCSQSTDDTLRLAETKDLCLQKTKFLQTEGSPYVPPNMNYRCFPTTNYDKSTGTLKCDFLLGYKSYPAPGGTIIDSSGNPAHGPGTEYPSKLQITYYVRVKKTPEDCFSQLVPIGGVPLSPNFNSLSSLHQTMATDKYFVLAYPEIYRSSLTDKSLLNDPEFSPIIPDSPPGGGFVYGYGIYLSHISVNLLQMGISENGRPPEDASCYVTVSDGPTFLLRSGSLSKPCNENPSVSIVPYPVLDLKGTDPPHLEIRIDDDSGSPIPKLIITGIDKEIKIYDDSSYKLNEILKIPIDPKQFIQPQTITIAARDNGKGKNGKNCDDPKTTTETRQIGLPITQSPDFPGERLIELPSITYQLESAKKIGIIEGGVKMTSIYKRYYSIDQGTLVGTLELNFDPIGVGDNSNIAPPFAFAFTSYLKGYDLDTQSYHDKVIGDEDVAIVDAWIKKYLISKNGDIKVLNLKTKISNGKLTLELLGAPEGEKVKVFNLISGADPIQILSNAPPKVNIQDVDTAKDIGTTGRDGAKITIATQRKIFTVNGQTYGGVADMGYVSLEESLGNGYDQNIKPYFQDLRIEATKAKQIFSSK